MAKFIVLHKEVMLENIEIREVLVNIEQVTHVLKNGKKYTRVTFVSGLCIDATESYDEVVRLINRSDYK